MPGTRVDNSPEVARQMHDISSWERVDITTLSTREKRRYRKYKAAIQDYFTTDASIDAITLRHHVSRETLEKLAQKCLMQHEDGKPSGWRALLPGVTVVDHTPELHAEAAPAEVIPAEVASAETIAETTLAEEAPAEVTAVDEVPAEAASIEASTEEAEAVPAAAAPVEAAPAATILTEEVSAEVTSIEAEGVLPTSGGQQAWQPQGPPTTPPGPAFVVERAEGEVTVVETAPAEAPAVEEVPAEVAPVEAAPAEAIAADALAAEEAPAEVAAVEEASAETTLAEEAPAEVTAVDEVPAEAASIEARTMEAAPAEAPAEVTSIEAAQDEASTEEAEAVPAAAAPVEAAPAATTLTEEVSAEVVPSEADNEVTAVEAPTAEAVPAEVAPVEGASAATTPTEEAPAEVAPAETTLAEEIPAEVAAVEEAPAEAISADAPAVEEAPAQVAAVAEAPAATTLAEEVLAEVVPSEAAQDEAGTEEAAPAEVASAETITEATLTEEIPAQAISVETTSAEVPAEVAAVEEAPAVTTLTEEALAQVIPVETTSAEAPAEVAAVEAAPAPTTLTEEVPAEVVPSEADNEVTPFEVAPAEAIFAEVPLLEQFWSAVNSSEASAEAISAEVPPATSEEEVSESDRGTINRDALAGILAELDQITIEDEQTEEEEDTAKRLAIKSLSQSTSPGTETPGVLPPSPARRESEVATLEETPKASEPLTVAQEGPSSSELATVAQSEEVALEETPTASKAATLDTGAGETQPAVDVGMELIPFAGAGITSVTGTTSALLPIYDGKRYPSSFKKAVQQRRLVRKRWVRDVRWQRQQKRLQRIFSMALVAALLVTMVIPLGVGLAAYNAYNHIRGLASDGVNHLLNVKSVLNVAKTNPTAALNVTKLQQAYSDFNKAEGDFTELQQLVERSDVQAAIQQFAPEYGGKLTMVQRLVQVGLDVSRMGSEMSRVGLFGASILHSAPLANGSTKPLITTAEVAAIEGALVHALYYIDDVQFQMSQVRLQDLPISNKQKAELVSVLALLPKARGAIVQAQNLVGIAAWVLGVGQKRRFLVQTMDRAELRPGGGFTGQYGILEIQDGRMAPFNLRDVALLDYAGNGVELGRLPPPQYKWMNFGNWGLRDANLSGDFPTTARLAMQVFQEEGGGPVDGNIALTPTAIAHVLDVTGPIKVPDYGEVITSKNLEERIHYYQQDFAAIAIEQQKTHSYAHAVRKAFTALVGKLLLERVRHLPVSQLMLIAKGATRDIQSHDLEIYFTNPAAEAWLVEHGYSGAMDTFSNQDGFMVVQANISISKASQYVHTTEHDDVTLDAQGGATHNLTITLDYNQTGPVYGFDTYADYIRVYAPASAQFITGDGFDTGKPLCTPSTPPPSPDKPPKPGPIKGCSQYNSSFPSSARYCPNGNYSLGAHGYTLDNSKGVWPVDSLGPPTALTSDLPGRAMFGGLTETPKNCTSTITVSWYVPHAVKNVAGHPSYSILVQKQGGYIPTVQISVDTSALKGLKPFKYSGDLIADKVFLLPVSTKK